MRLSHSSFVPASAPCFCRVGVALLSSGCSAHWRGLPATTGKLLSVVSRCFMKWCCRELAAIDGTLTFDSLPAIHHCCHRVHRMRERKAGCGQLMADYCLALVKSYCSYCRLGVTSVMLASSLGGSSLRGWVVTISWVGLTFPNSIWWV